MTWGSFLALSIQRVTVLSEGNSRTSLRLVLVAAKAWTSLRGLRNLSSLTVLTPAARKSSEYSHPTPLTRMRSAAVTQSRTCFSSVPIFAAILSRCFGVLPDRSKLTVVRIPSDLRITAVSAPMARILVMGYAIGTSPQSRNIAAATTYTYSNKLRETGYRADDRTDLVLADFLARISDGLPGDALHL